jgi:hypothetical protein
MRQRWAPEANRDPAMPEVFVKTDFKQSLKHLYGPAPTETVEVDVPPMNFLMIDGDGDPNTSKAYAEAVEALFGVSYAVKFMVKKGPMAIDYGVMPLEGLWWVDDMSKFSTTEKSKWKWTAMIMQPPPVTRETVDKAISETAKKKPMAALGKLRFETLVEGRCAQTLHVGRFTEEGLTIARLHHFIEAQGCRLTGKHHEIYLSDIRRADPTKWKTVVRQPMECVKGT